MRIVLWYQGMDLRSEVYAVVPDLDPDIIGFKIHTEEYTKKSRGKYYQGT